MLLEFNFSEIDKDTDEESTKEAAEVIEKGNLDDEGIVEGKFIFRSYILINYNSKFWWHMINSRQLA